MSAPTEPEPDRPPAADDAWLETLLFSYLERSRDAGGPPALEDHCAERPDLLPALRNMIRLAGGLPGADRGDDALLGRRLGGRYVLTGRLGAGAMGLVYAARDEQLDREVAVKVLEDIFASDPQRVERFRREAQSLAGLDDPHIVAVHDLDLEAHPPYLVMDRVRGFDLAALLGALRADVPDGQMPRSDDVQRAAAELAGVSRDELAQLFEKPWPEFTAVVGVQMCAALGRAHDVGVVHRDVKPSNFMLDATGRLRLLDFGLARREIDASLTRTEARPGTPLYMAPEQMRGEEAAPASDLYSIGATLYECLCLRAPFADSTASQFETKVLYDDPEPPRTLRDKVPGDLEAICLVALAKSPHKRYASAGELGEDLQRFLHYEPVDARARIWPRPLRALVGSYRRHRRAAAVVGVIAVLAIGAVVAASGFFGNRAAERELERRREVAALVAGLPPTLGLGNSLEDRRRHPHRWQFLADLDRILELDPDHAEARFLRLCVREEDESPDGALLQAERQHLVDSVGRERLAALRVAVAHLRDRDHAEACEVLEQLPTSTAQAEPVAMRLQIIAALLSGELESARMRTLAMEERHGPTALTHWARGMVRLLGDEDSDARKPLQTSYELSPHHVNTLHALAQVNRRLKDHDTAERYMREALAHFDRPHVRYLHQYALILRDRRRFDEAEAVTEQYPADERFRREFDLAALRIWRGLAAEEPAAGARFFEQAEDELRNLLASETPGSSRWRKKARSTLARAIALQSDASEERYRVYLGLLAEDPLNPAVIGFLAESVEDRGQAQMARWLRNQRAQLIQLEAAGILDL